MSAKAKTASKNNPDSRGPATAARKYKGKAVKPVLYIDRKVGKYIAAMYEDGNLVIDPVSKLPLAYQKI